MIELTVKVFKTKNAAINFIENHFELCNSSTVTIEARDNGGFAVIEYINLNGGN